MNKDLTERKGIIIRGLAIVDHDFYPSEAKIAQLQEYGAQFDIDPVFGTEISADSAQVHIIGTK